jgi:hypothetical protein
MVWEKIQGQALCKRDEQASICKHIKKFLKAVYNMLQYQAIQ